MRWNAALLVLLAACPGPTDSVEDSTASHGAAPATPDIAEFERLKALGYIDETLEPVDPERTRVVHWDRERAQDGYRLYCNRDGAVAELIEIDGSPVHSWRDTGTLHWMACALMANGDLVVVGAVYPEEKGSPPLDEHRHIARLDWDGRPVWHRNITAHHDVFVVDDGSLITLTLGYRDEPSIDSEWPVRDDFLVRISGDGEVLEERSILDAFRSNPDELSIQPVEPKNQWGRRHVDLIHANSVSTVDWKHLEGRHEIYARGNVVVTSRNQDLVAIIEWASNELVWAWGQGQLSGPHEGQVLANGNVLIFDNGIASKRSRVIEVDPLSREIVWEYTAPVPADFFTPGRGGAQRLDNGNTLVTNSNHGQAFEVTPEGEMVWEFLNPHLNEERHRKTFRRMQHLPRGFVEGILAERGAAPTGS